MKKICYVTTIATTIRAFFIPQLEYLSNNGFDGIVICSPDVNLESELSSDIKYVPIHIARGVKPHTLLKSIFSLIKTFRSENFDMVQYSTPNAAFCASIAAKLAGVKIRNYHLMGLRYLGMSGFSAKIFKLIEKITCKLSTHIECVTKSNIELCVKEKLFKPEKVTMVWNGSSGGVDIKRFDCQKRDKWAEEVRAELGLSRNDFIFGFVGRITRDKGINELTQAFLKLDNVAKLLIIGNKEGIETLNKNLWERAKRNSNIIILDSVTDIERYYAAMDVLVLPSYREGFGMVIAEAAAVGTPAIISNIPGPIDVIKENETAFVVEPRNIESLYEKMKEIVGKKELLDSMSKTCVKYITEQFDGEILNEKILERKKELFLER